ncbi:MAG: hypothetical protein J5502_04335 [Prevotella sp.]|nr:hypothetical protein [Prevotella sp.]
MARLRIVSIRNMYGVKVKKCCASCAFRAYNLDGIRICGLDKEEVAARFRCKKWQMSDGLKKAGRGGCVVRDIVTKEVILQ